MGRVRVAVIRDIKYFDSCTTMYVCIVTAGHLYLLLDMRVIYATTMSPASPGRSGSEGDMRA